MKKSKNGFLSLVSNPFKFNLYLLTKLPSAFFSGVRIQEVTSEHCIVTIHHKWFNQNPFKSTYFACLSMAAEMSTGVLSMANTYKSIPAISMLVINMKASFGKKAIKKTTFTCTDGIAIKQAIDKAIETGESYTFNATSIGVNQFGEQVACFEFTWSYKVK